MSTELILLAAGIVLPVAITTYLAIRVNKRKDNIAVPQEELPAQVIIKPRTREEYERYLDQHRDEQDLKDVMDFVAKMEIPEVKVSAVSVYIRDIKRRHPHMGNQRVLRKTAEYFSLKPKQVTGLQEDVSGDTFDEPIVIIEGKEVKMADYPTMARYSK